jgi:uncharacterized protein (DUF1501 family)
MATHTRRELMKMTAALPAVVAWPQWMPRLAFAPPHTSPRGDVLICVFLRGAADGVNMIVPHGDEQYYAHRPSLAIPRPDDPGTTSSQRTIDLDGFFGLHPALSPLLPVWQAGDFAAVQAVGSPHESRSHSGWLGRHLATLDTGNHSPLRGVTIGEMVAHALRGPVPATALRSIADFHLGGDPKAIAEMQSALAALYSLGDPLDPIAAEAMNTLEAVNALDPLGYRPANGVVYPDDDFGLGLRQVAILIKAEVGLEVACLDVGGWDTHIAQGSSEGLMASLLRNLAQALSAFYLDMAEHADKLVVVVMSEFGRRLKENGGLGTDHGHGGLMLLLGGHIAGGRVFGSWPGLAREQLVGPGDLAVTTDYRDILAEIISRRLNNPHLDAIFPGFRPSFRHVILE